MTRLRLPLRLARREVWRRPGRTALVALLVAIPVAGMAMSVVLIRTDRSTSALEQWERSYGQADAYVYSAAPPTVGGTGRADAEIQHDVSSALPAPPPGSQGGGPTTTMVSDDLLGPGMPGADEPVVLPPGSRSVSVATHWERLRTADGHRGTANIRDLPLLDPITVGIHDLIEGRPATQRGEAVLSASLARRLHVQVGEDLVLDRPEVTLKVVGLVEPVGCLSCGQLLVAPGEIDVFPAVAVNGSDVSHLVDLPELTDAEQGSLANTTVLQLRAIDAEHSSLESEQDSSPVRWSYVLGAVVLTVVGIVIAAAFAVGARRQLVTLGQLSASGAAPSTVRLALVLQGTVTGLVGTVAGLVLAAAALLLGQGLVERILDERIDGYVARLTDILWVVAIGVTAATVAALLPARTAARIPTLAALAGRRPLHPVSRRLVAWGGVTFLGGLGLLGLAVIGARSGDSGDVWMYVAILGGVAELLGACAIAPAIVARLEPLATRLRGSWRLGARGLARHRSRTGAVVSAVAAAGALAVVASGLLQGMDAREGVETDVPDDTVVLRSLSYDEETGFETSVAVPDEMLRAVQDALPDAAAFELHGTERVQPDPEGPFSSGTEWELVVPPNVDRYYGSPSAIVADDEVLEVLRLPSEARKALDDGLVVWLTADGAGGAGSVRLPDGRVVDGVSVQSRYTLGWFASVLASEDRLDELGLRTEPLATVLQNPQTLSSTDRDALDDATYAMEGAAGEDLYTDARWHHPSNTWTPFQIELLLTGLALIFSVFVVGVSLALAAAEAKDERDILTVAGAPPGTLARSSGARAWLLAAIGGVMAVPIGFLPVIVFSRADADAWRPHFPVIFPTRTVLILVLLVPAVVAAVAWCASAAAQRLRPVRVSTATFE